jgi:hypothetical protein
MTDIRPVVLLAGKLITEKRDNIKVDIRKTDCEFRN